MTDHKFEPFEKVLVRDDDNREWNASFFSHIEDDSDYKFMCCGMFWKQCIPYTPETAHLLGTTQPYEPPKPPQEYEWGQKVEVLQNGEWRKAIFIEPYYSSVFNGAGATVMPLGKLTVLNYPPDRIRPLPDSAAQ